MENRTCERHHGHGECLNESALTLWDLRNEADDIDNARKKDRSDAKDDAKMFFEFNTMAFGPLSTRHNQNPRPRGYPVLDVFKHNKVHKDYRYNVGGLAYSPVPSKGQQHGQHCEKRMGTDLADSDKGDDHDDDDNGWIKCEKSENVTTPKKQIKYEICDMDPEKVMKGEGTAEVDGRNSVPSSRGSSRRKLGPHVQNPILFSYLTSDLPSILPVPRMPSGPLFPTDIRTKRSEGMNPDEIQKASEDGDCRKEDTRSEVPDPEAEQAPTDRDEQSGSYSFHNIGKVGSISLPPEKMQKPLPQTRTCSQAALSLPNSQGAPSSSLSSTVRIKQSQESAWKTFVSSKRKSEHQAQNQAVKDSRPKLKPKERVRLLRRLKPKPPLTKRELVAIVPFMPPPPSPPPSPPPEESLEPKKRKSVVRVKMPLRKILPKPDHNAPAPVSSQSVPVPSANQQPAGSQTYVPMIRVPISRLPSSVDPKQKHSQGIQIASRQREPYVLAPLFEVTSTAQMTKPVKVVNPKEDKAKSVGSRKVGGRRKENPCKARSRGEAWRMEEAEKLPERGEEVSDSEGFIEIEDDGMFVREEIEQEEMTYTEDIEQEEMTDTEEIEQEERVHREEIEQETMSVSSRKAGGRRKENPCKARSRGEAWRMEEAEEVPDSEGFIEIEQEEMRDREERVHKEEVWEWLDEKVTAETEVEDGEAVMFR